MLLPFQERQPFHILEYKTLVADPLTCVKKIYKQFDFCLQPEVEKAMKRHLVDNKQAKHGKHKYKMEDYGITTEMVESKCRPYLDFFRTKSADL